MVAADVDHLRVGLAEPLQRGPELFVGGDVAGQHHDVHVNGGVAQLVEEGEPLVLGEELQVEVAVYLDAHAG